jgi:hypothetical protein
LTRSIVPASIVLAALAGASPALAEGSAADRALAQSLFDDGRRLMQAGKLAEACPLLERSEALDPSGGTMLNLAHCHEQQGRIATAWTEYHDALMMARRDRREDREEFALTHIAALEPGLSRLTVNVAPGALPEGFEILRDGAPLNRAGWNVAAPVDPGPHEIAARAPGYEGWGVKIVVGDRADAKFVEIPALRKRAGGPLVAGGKAVPPSTSGGVQRPLGFTLLGVGLLAAGVGAGFGAHALAQEGTAHTQCGSDATCASPSGLSASRDAVTSAKVADGLIGGGLALAGIGLVVALTAKSAGDAAPSPTAALVVAPRRLGLALSF